MMKNYENRLKAIKKIADGKTAKVVFLDCKNGKHYLTENKLILILLRQMLSSLMIYQNLWKEVI